MASIVDRAKNAWNVFRGLATATFHKSYGESSYSRQDRQRLSRGNRQSIVSSPLNRIAVDCASIDIYHCKVDENGQFKEVIDDELTKIFQLSANTDQAGTAFVKDIVLSMLDEGVVAIVPTDTDTDYISETTYGYYKMRTGKITEWFPQHVRVNLYDENDGRHKDIVLPKSKVAIVENPFYEVMNEPNSTLQRLIQKINLLDSIDNRNGSGKLDVFVKLPYSLRTERHKDQAKARKEDIEDILANSKYGIAYIDSTENVTQLNRPVENTLPQQIKDLQETFYNQLGLTKSIFDGTASESEMLNYYNRTIEPILSAIVDELKRKFLTSNAISMGHSFCFIRDPFKLAPVEKIADLVDKFTTAEVMSSNEFRAIVGRKPSDDPAADELRNKHLNREMGEMDAMAPDESMGGEQPPPTSRADRLEMLLNMPQSEARKMFMQ
jgi:hypothetical protein